MFAGAAVIICVLTVILRQQKPEYGIVVTICAGVVMLTVVMDSLLPAVREIGAIMADSGAEGYLPPVLKAFGVHLITQIAADICRDAGQQSVANQVEIAGRLAMLVIALPLLSSVLATAVASING